jgi:hypothetical protein
MKYKYINAHGRWVGGWGADLINSLTRKKGATQGRELKRAISTIGTPSTRHNTLPRATDPLTTFVFVLCTTAHAHARVFRAEPGRQRIAGLASDRGAPSGRPSPSRPVPHRTQIHHHLPPLSIVQHSLGRCCVGDEQNDVPKRAAVYVPAGQKSSVSLAQQAAQQLEGASPSSA